MSSNIFSTQICVKISKINLKNKFSPSQFSFSKSWNFNENWKWEAQFGPFYIVLAICLLLKLLDYWFFQTVQLVSINKNKSGYKSI